MGGIVDNPQVQNAINSRPQQPRQLGQFGQQPQQPQQPGQVQPQLNDPLNRGGMSFQGFNPAGTDVDPRRPFVSSVPLQLLQSGRYNPQSLQDFQNMFQGQTQPMNPNQVYAGGTPNFDERTSTYINPPRLPIIQPGPGVFPQPQPQDSKRGLGGLQLNKFRNRLS